MSLCVGVTPFEFSDAQLQGFEFQLFGIWGGFLVVRCTVSVVSMDFLLMVRSRIVL